MIATLVIGLWLVIVAAALVIRAAGMARRRVTAGLEQAGAYGYPDVNLATPEALDPLIGRVADRLGNQFGEAEKPGLKELLMSAGMYEMSVRKLQGYRVIAVLGVGSVWMYLSKAMTHSMGLRLAGTALALMVGWRLPLIVAEKRAAKRLDEVDREIPELIDSMIVTIEGGMGFSGALRLAADRAPGALGDEIKLALREQDMGLSMERALKNLVARIDTPSMRSFVRSVLQAESLGVPMGEILRALAIEMRAKRRADAEERAMKAPVKMLFPLVGLIFPSLFIVLLYPGMSQMMKSFSQMG
jgi:tight adherence protein C